MTDIRANFAKELYPDTPMVTEEITTMFDSELTGFLARRYNKSEREIIHQFLIQNRNVYSESPLTDSQETGFTLESNEMEILRAYYNKKDSDKSYRGESVKI